MILELNGGKVFPARAGMIRTDKVISEKLSSIPRESGDDPNAAIFNCVGGGYSPRERG